MTEDKAKSFWSSAPGILTGIAGVITAIVALIGALYQAGVFGGDGRRPDDRQQEVQGPPPPEPAPGPSTGSNAPAGETPAPGFRIVEVFLRADPFNYSGPCPVKITFSGRISVAGGGGDVTYKFLRSDGASAPVQTLHFDESGSKDISTTWTLGASGRSFEGWQVIETFDPQGREWDPAAFQIHCS